MSLHVTSRVLLASLGDVSPEHGSLRLYGDPTGVERPVLEAIRPLHENDCDCDDADEYGDCTRFELRSATVERFKIVRLGGRLGAGYFVACEYQPDWPMHVSQYVPFFGDVESMRDVANSAGVGDDELIDALCSENPVERAEAYRNLIGYHGWANFDEYPIELTAAEVTARLAHDKKASA